MCIGCATLHPFDWSHQTKHSASSCSPYRASGSALVPGLLPLRGDPQTNADAMCSWTECWMEEGTAPARDNQSNDPHHRRRICNAVVSGQLGPIGCPPEWQHTCSQYSTAYCSRCILGIRVLVRPGVFRRAAYRVDVHDESPPEGRHRMRGSAVRPRKRICASRTQHEGQRESRCIK